MAVLAEARNKAAAVAQQKDLVVAVVLLLLEVEVVPDQLRDLGAAQLEAEAILPFEAAETKAEALAVISVKAEEMAVALQAVAANHLYEKVAHKVAAVV